MGRALSSLPGGLTFFRSWARLVVQALYHWDFDADAQFGEINYNTDALQLSYWVDYWLARMFPHPPGANMLQFTNTDDPEIEVLAVQNPHHSVVVMLANHAVNASTDNNGPGAPRPSVSTFPPSALSRRAAC